MALGSALKTTVGILTAWAIVLWYQWPDPFLAPIAVLFLQTPYLGSSLLKGLMRVLGTLAGALLVLGLLTLVTQERWPLITAVSLILAGSVYMIRHSRYGYAWFMLAITTAIIALDAWMHPMFAFELAVYRTSEAIVGILVVLTINGVFWPRTGGRVYANAYRDTVSGIADHLRETARSLSGSQGHEFPRLSRTLVGAPIRLREVLTAAALDSANFRRLHSTYEAQIQGLTAMLGSLTGFAETLYLAAESERAFLSKSQRDLFASALTELATAAKQVSVGAEDASATPVTSALDAARGLRERLHADASQKDQSGTESALLQALESQLWALSKHIEQQQRAANAIAAGRSLPPDALPTSPRLPLTERIAEALPNAVLMALVFWLLILLQIWFQWPPSGFLGVLMGVVIIGIETLQNAPALAPGRRVAAGAVIGVLVTAPFYLVIMPGLDGYWELAIALFPLFFAITYFYHAVAPPRNMLFTGMALTTIIMLQLEPRQTYDVVGYIGSAASLLTGFGTALAVLGLARAHSPQEHLRRTLKAIFRTMRLAQADLSDLRSPDIAARFARHEQRLRQSLQVLAQVLPIANSARNPGNSRARIQDLGAAVERLVLRFRALHRERAHWSGEARERLYASSIGRTLSPAIQQTLERFIHSMDAPSSSATTQALDQARDAVRAELSRLEAHRRALDNDTDVISALTIAGHYVAVAHALREVGAALGEIDWPAWRIVRF